MRGLLFVHGSGREGWRGGVAACVEGVFGGSLVVLWRGGGLCSHRICVSGLQHQPSTRALKREMGSFEIAS